MVPHLSTTPSYRNTYLSLPVIFTAVIITMLVGMSIAYWVLDMMAGMGIATTWASNYISTIQGIISAFDFIALFSFGILFGAVIIRSYRLNTHPVYGIVGLLGIPVVVIATGYASNIVAIFTQFEVLGEALNQFNYIILFVQNSPLIIGAASVLVLLVMVGGGRRAPR